MHNVQFLREISTAFSSVELLTQMPHLADWERDTRMKAIYATLARRMDEWWKLHHESTGTALPN